MEKLTVYKEPKYPCQKGYWTMRDDVSAAQVCAKLAPLEIAEEEKRLAILPCKIGSTIYEIDPPSPEHDVIKCRVNYIVIGVMGLSVDVEVIEGHGAGSVYSFEQSEFGDIVFLTLEEAEAALAKGGRVL